MSSGGGKRCRRKRRRRQRRRRRRSTRKRGGRTECSDYHENPVESVAPRGRKTGPADKNHSRCVTYRFECDGRRSLPILFTLRSLFPPSACPCLSTLSRSSRSLGFSRSSLARAIYKTPRPDPCKLPPLNILASTRVQFLLCDARSFLGDDF